MMKSTLIDAKSYRQYDASACKDMLFSLSDYRAILGILAASVIMFKKHILSCYLWSANLRCKIIISSVWQWIIYAALCKSIGVTTIDDIQARQLLTVWHGLWRQLCQGATVHLDTIASIVESMQADPSQWTVNPLTKLFFYFYCIVIHVYYSRLYSKWSRQNRNMIRWVSCPSLHLVNLSFEYQFNVRYLLHVSFNYQHYNNLEHKLPKYLVGYCLAFKLRSVNSVSVAHLLAARWPRFIL